MPTQPVSETAARLFQLPPKRLLRTRGHHQPIRSLAQAGKMI